MGHHTCLREKDDLPLSRGPAAKKKKKTPFFNARAPITREIMRSRDAQCITRKW